MEMNFCSRGVGAAALTTGIIGTAGTALNLLGGGLGNLLGGNAPRNACHEDHSVSRYEAAQAARIAELETEVKLRDANTYTDQKLLEMYRYVDGKFGCVESQICNQAVVNANITANISCMQTAIAGLQALTKTVIPIGNVCPLPATATTTPTTTG